MPTIVIILLSIMVGIFVGFMIGFIWLRKKLPWAGNIIVDLHRDCLDVIRIESPRNLSKWKNYKELRFDVIVEGP